MYFCDSTNDQGPHEEWLLQNSENETMKIHQRIEAATTYQMKLP